MNKLLITLLLIIGSMLTGCNKESSDTYFPITFAEQNVFVYLGKENKITFVYGGGEYEIFTEHADILGQVSIDQKARQLLITPAALGSSWLKIHDKKANATVQLDITVKQLVLDIVPGED